MLTSISLANAGALWAGLLIPLLVLAYLKTKRDKSLLVSSVLILRSLKQQAVLRSRVRLPWRFYLELLIMLLLLFAAALPTRPQPNQAIALVIDNSLSMQALDTSGKSRLELAKEHARSFLEDLAGSVRVSVFSSSPKLLLLNAKPVSPSEGIAELGAIMPSASADNLSSDLKVLGESGRFTLVLAISDAPVEFSGAGDASAKPTSGNIIAEVRGLKVGTPSENYYVANLHYGNAVVSAEELSVAASFGWSGFATRKVTAIVEAVDPNTGFRDILKKEAVSLSPNRTTDISFTGLRRGKGGVEVRLEDAPSVENSIKVDDRAWLPPQGGKKSAVLLVSENSNSGVMGLNAISSLLFEQVTPTQFATLDPSVIAAYELIIFHQSAPRSAVGVPSLFILPPDTNDFFPVARTIENGQITSWREQHPLTSYLKVPLLPLNRALVFSVQPWSQSIINIEQGPLVVAGESVGVRYVGVGTELLPFEGEKTPAQSVLTINIINWLLGSSGSVGNSFITGAVYVLDKRHEWRVVQPDRQTITVGKEQPGGRELSLDMPGIYRLENDTAGEPYELAVNCFHPGESATAGSRPFVLPKYIESQVNARQEEEPLWPLLLKFACVLLAVDWIYRLLGRARNVSH